MRAYGDSITQGPSGDRVSAASGIALGTQILTLDGLMPVEFLAPGDRIITRSGASRLVSLSIHDRRNVQAVRITASTLGHGEPVEDVLLGPGQSVLIRDWRARALYAADQAAIPASRLVDEEFIRLELHRSLRLFTLRFAADEVIYAGGIELVCAASVAAAAQRDSALGG